VIDERSDKEQQNSGDDKSGTAHEVISGKGRI
jgi:hypothetical protein